VEWALLLLALFVALILRYYRLEQVPLGLYRDEAMNGLDALRVLQGEHAIFFPANNGREPLFIYLTALSVALFGQTAFAVRFTAAFIGTLTTLPVYLLGKSWFSWRVGVLAAWIWAITLWPVHLSRIGLRVILLAPLLTLALWVGTLAFRREKKRLWFLTGLLYGFIFYTYLAARFTPFLLILLLLFLILTGRKRQLWPGAAWFVLGSFLVLLPFIFLIGQEPDLILGRSGQVSLLHPDVNKGDLWGTLWQQIGATAGMFIWRGDTILRHNPAGRPLFDLLMVIPFLIGLIWSLRHWRRPSAMTLLIWIAVMLGPTILAADAPHFLRAAGILPVIVYLPAIGLERIWLWPRLSPILRSLLVAALILGSLFLTVRDYAAYALDPEMANAFEYVAAELARQINDEAEDTDVFLDKRLWSNWPSLQFLITEPEDIHMIASPVDLSQRITAPVSFYVWPYETLDYLPEVLASPVIVSSDGSDLIYSELDDSSYQLYVRYHAEEVPDNLADPLAEFEGGFILQNTDVLELADGRLQVDVYWQLEKELKEELVVFVHVIGAGELIGQHDAPPADGHWPTYWWQSGQIVLDRHLVTLEEPYDAGQHQIQLGLYSTSTGERLPVSDAATGEPLGTSWTIGSN
jgi:hypothetical protein